MKIYLVIFALLFNGLIYSAFAYADTCLEISKMEFNYSATGADTMEVTFDNGTRLSIEAKRRVQMLILQSAFITGKPICSKNYLAFGRDKNCASMKNIYISR